MSDSTSLTGASPPDHFYLARVVAEIMGACLQGYQNVPGDTTDRRTVLAIRFNAALAGARRALVEAGVAPLEAVRMTGFVQETAGRWLSRDFNPLTEPFTPLSYNASAAAMEIGAVLEAAANRPKSPPQEKTGNPPDPPTKPCWDQDKRELWFGNVLCKKYKRQAPNEERILASFEEDGWPARIDDPLDDGKLADTLRDLNEALKGQPLHFIGDGTGTAILWEIISGHLR